MINLKYNEVVTALINFFSSGKFDRKEREKMKVDMKLSRLNKTAGKNALLEICFQAPKSVCLF